MKAESIQKKDALTLWRTLSDNAELTPAPIPYKHRGTTIDEDGVRICGSKPFILAVLSRLKPLLAFENCDTRLGISFSEITDKDTQEVIAGKFRCSVQVHERGDEARHFNHLVQRRTGTSMILTGVES